MASGTRSANTMNEQLRNLLGQIADMKAAPDADIAYLTSLETQVLQYLRQPFEQQRMQAQLQGPQGAGGQGAPPGGGMDQSATAQLLGMTPGGAPAGGQGDLAQLLMAMGAPVGRQQRVAGVMRGHTMPNGDELRRLMEQPAL
jgi:hypothetical protein